jgi:hypothetical protein
MSNHQEREVAEVLLGFLQSVAKVLVVLGGLACAIAATFLIFTIYRVSTGANVNAADALRNANTFSSILTVGVIALGVGSTYLYWGEEILGAIQLLLAGAFFFAPVYLPLIFGGTTNEASGAAYGALQAAGSILGAIGIIVMVVDLSQRMKLRVTKGVKADQLRYGKGVKEDPDRQNVFLGKCWQLPYCRKFVRERCPIYHSKRTCWKERVGCMCEEEVIRNAMENRPVPKDALLAANMIPRNNRLTMAQKQERCRNCVIYNEHQKHKYKAMLPATLLFFIAVYALFRQPLLSATSTMLDGTNRMIQAGTLDSVRGFQTPAFFVETLLVLIMVVLLSYSLKLIEFLVFKLKI